VWSLLLPLVTVKFFPCLPFVAEFEESATLTVNVTVTVTVTFVLAAAVCDVLVLHIYSDQSCFSRDPSYQSTPSPVHSSTSYSLEYPADPNSIQKHHEPTTELQQSLPLTEQRPAKEWRNHGMPRLGENGRDFGAATQTSAVEESSTSFPAKRRWQPESKGL
jgi:hypothetical protein